MKRPISIMLLILVTTILLSACSSPHITIDIANVDRAYIHLSIKDENQIREIAGSDLNDLVKWFNSASGIRSNPTFKGATTIVGMNIELRDRRHITILDSGDNFEIQIADPIKGKTVSYWAKEPHIESMLAKIDNVQ